MSMIGRRRRHSFVETWRIGSAYAPLWRPSKQVSIEQPFLGLHVKHARMHRLFLPPALSAMAVLFATLIHAQTVSKAKILPPVKAAVHVHITEGPALESVKDDLAIIRWTSNNPGGSDEHFGVVHYGTNPEHLSQTAKSHIRLNQNHPTTVFRVRVDGLKPKSTYYYTVDSMQGNGKSDGVKSTVRRFTTP
jgi:phosphodiesterase/alkaline phosphatase D-like protein